MRKPIVLVRLFMAAAFFFVVGGAIPAFAQTPLARQSVSVVTSGGLGGGGTYASDMVFARWAGTQGGWGWAGGASAVQGSAATHTGQTGGGTVVAANEVFSFNLGTVVSSLNSAYGAGNWTIASPTLAFQSSYSVQNNSRFGLGSGTFNIFWVANNNWAQSTGTEDNREFNPPYESSATALATWAGSLADLGNQTFAIPEGGSGDKPMSCPLSTSDPNYPLFVSAITNPTPGGGTLYSPYTAYPALTLYLMGTDDTIGMLVFTGGPGGSSEPPPTLSFDVVANVSVTPNPLAFPGTPIGTSSAAQTLTVTNAAQSVWSIGTLTLSGTDATDFTIAPDTDACSGTTLSAGGNCTVSVVFSPTSEGSRSASVTVPLNLTFNGQDYATSVVTSVAGTGGVATVTVAPQSLDFGVVLLPDRNEGGNVPAGCTDNLNGTVSCSVTIRNTSAVALPNIGLSTVSPFTVSPPAISSILAPNETATATVTYTATSGRNGTDTGTLTVHAGGDTALIDLTATTSSRPGTPVNESPLEATTVSSTPTLTASAFSDADGDTHRSSTWEIGTSSEFADDSIVYSSENDTTNLVSLPVPTGALASGTTYFWRIVYTDSRGGVSLPSAVTSFTTAAVPMNTSGTSPLAMTVTDSSGNEVTSLSQLASAAAGVAVSPRVFADLGSSVTINSGTNFDPNSGSPTVAIVRENGGSSNDVLAVVTPPGTNIVALKTTVTTDPSFGSLPPANYAFPAGVVSFLLTGVAGSNNPVRITLYTPTDLPANAVWYKYTPARGWLIVNANGVYDGTGTSLISSATTFTVVNGKGVLSITDNDVTDLNRQSGVVLDPGAPAVPVAATSTQVADPGPPGGGGGCFIATAAFGSYLSPYVSILRNFRDTFLLTTKAGSTFVAWYYRGSPSIAQAIAGDERLKAGVRAGLIPVIGFSFLCLRLGIMPATMVSALLFLVIGIPVVAGGRRLLCGWRRG